MISATTLCKELLNVNGLVVDDTDFFTNKYGELCILIKVHLRKGHSYITVVVNHETNTVIWAAKDHGKSVLKKFCEQLTPEQRASIQVVTGDGARWITDCVKEYFPNAERCVDPFHVVEWAAEALDKVRIAAWRRAQEAAKAVAVSRGKGRPRKDDTEARIAAAARKKADQIKKSMYSLGKAPEHLTSNIART